MWSELSPAVSAASAPPVLGYRGSTLRSPDGRVWRAESGVVSAAGPQNAEARSDDTRAWERRLLETAPDGTLPAGWRIHDRKD